MLRHLAYEQHKNNWNISQNFC